MTLAKSHSIFVALLSAAGALCAQLPAPARAGDYAERNILGFSPDGSTFAFEQFGVQDGSGFPYSDVFVVDTNSDRWVAGSPFRVLIKDERAQLKWARRQAMTEAGNLLREKLISAPGRLLGSNPPAEISADPHRIAVNASAAPTMTPEKWTYVLEEFPVPHKECAAFSSEPVKGFRLTARKEGNSAVLLHEDTGIPKSRGCALSYAISDIVIHEPPDSKRVFAILLSVFAHGFEGPDRRFLAVTARMP